jgi:hypothetical protein
MVRMKVMGTVPTISVEKTDGCQMYLSKESLATQLITAQSSEMNILIPQGTLRLQCQLQIFFIGKKLISIRGQSGQTKSFRLTTHNVDAHQYYTVTTANYLYGAKYVDSYFQHQRSAFVY